MTGLALLAVAAGAASGSVTAGPAGPASVTTVTVASGSARQPAADVPAAYVPAADVPVTDRGEPGDIVSGPAMLDGSDAGTAVDDESHGSVAPPAVFAGRPPAGASPRRTAACSDVVPLVGTAWAPCGPRAPPLRLT
jgi:hypothetical protein